MKEKLTFNRIILTSILAFLLGALLVTSISMYAFYRETEQEINRTQDLATSIFVESVSTDILLGQNHDIFRKCQKFSSNHMISSLEVSLTGSGRKLCDFHKTDTFDALEKSKVSSIYFDQSKKNTAATVTIGYSSERIQDNLKIMGILTIFGFGFILAGSVLAVASLSRFVSTPITDLAKGIKTLDLDALSLVELKTSFKIPELRDLYHGTKSMAQRLIILQKDTIEKAKSDSIARTTQMLAHDVRKPFSMLQGVLDIIDSANTFDEIKGITKQATPEIKRAIESVNGMIQDVMEVGSETQPMQEVVNPETILETTILDSFRYQKNTDIGFTYQLNDLRRLNIDVLKTSRVFSNIISNGAQAMGHKGSMWFRTRRWDDQLSQFTIGNSGSFIPPEDAEQLFEAFYTSGKKGGTGLGLAIAKKVIESHGGAIWCTSSREVGTEFHFTLPSLPLDSNYEGQLPSHSKDTSLPEVTTLTAPGVVTDESEPDQFSSQQERLDTGLLSSFRNEDLFESAFIELKKKEPFPTSILIVDDESLYLTVLKNQLNRNSDLAVHLVVKEARSGEEALRLLGRESFDVIIQDIDMGPGKLDGFETVKAMRDQHSNATICIHSNRGGPQYHKAAIESGADMFIAKTMPRGHFLRLLYATVGDPDELIGCETTAPELALENQSDIILVEDSDIIATVWRSLWPSIQVYTHPEALLASLEGSSASLDSVAAIIIDNNFGHLSETSGFELAGQLQRLGVKTPLLLSTGEDVLSADLVGVFSSQLPKNPNDGVGALGEFLARTKRKAAAASAEMTDQEKSRQHDIRTQILCLRLLCDQLDGGSFPRSIRQQIEVYARRLEELSLVPCGDAINRVAVKDPESLLGLILSFEEKILPIGS